MKTGKLYLIPVPIDQELSLQQIPEETKFHAARLKEFIVEKEKTARRVLKLLETQHHQNDLIFHDLGKHSDSQNYATYLKSCREGNDIGLMSESGSPAIADPGSEIVALAHEQGIEVVPLSGPSSLLMALIASGMNGQNFAFTGYLPKEKADKVERIKSLAKKALNENQSQILIETPFRVHQCMEDLSRHLPPQLKIALCLNMGTSDQKIIKKTAQEWKSSKIKEHKPLAVFVIGK